MVQKIDFGGQVAVVTGAGAGLGRAYALELARRGAKVVVNDLGGNPDGTGGDERPAAKVVEEINSAGGKAIANFDSVATPEGGRSIVDAALNQWGRIDALVSNAGILRDKSFLKMEFEDLEAILDVHLRGAFYVGKPAFAAMKQSGTGGRIVLTTSASGLFGNFGQANYCAAKLGLVGLMRVLTIEGRKANIKVNAISPVAGTRLTRGAAGDVDAVDPMSPTRVAPLISVLCHESCPSSGEIFLAAGGWYARSFVALCEGWITDEAQPMAEDILRHWEDIRSSKILHEPADAMDIGKMMRARLDV